MAITTSNGTQTGHRRDTDGTAAGQRRDKEERKEKKGIKEKKGKEGVPPDFENFDLTKRIGKDAARLWNESGAGAILNGKSEITIEWLAYRCDIGKPLRSHYELTELVKLVKESSPARLSAMMAYSVKGQYPALYPDFDKNDNPGAAGFPDKYDKAFESKLNGPQLSAYWQHLRKLGWWTEKYQGREYWKPPKQSEIPGMKDLRKKLSAEK